MKSKVIQAALKILLIKEEYSAKEIDEAILLLQDNKESSPLFTFLASNKGNSQQENKSKKGKKNITEQSSQILIELKRTDYDKFLILSELDSLLRKGEILKQLKDIKSFAARISKEFPETKARRDAIPKLIELLAELPRDEIKGVVEETLKVEKISIENSEYQELAHFLIKGPKNKDIKSPNN